MLREQAPRPTVKARPKHFDAQPPHVAPNSRSLHRTNTTPHCAGPCSEQKACAVQTLAAGRYVDDSSLRAHVRNVPWNDDGLVYIWLLPPHRPSQRLTTQDTHPSLRALQPKLISTSDTVPGRPSTCSVVPVRRNARLKVVAAAKQTCTANTA